MANANKQYIKDTIPCLKDAVERCYGRIFLLDWDFRKRVEETTRLLCIQSYKFKNFDDAYKYAEYIEAELQSKRIDYRLFNRIDYIVKEEFNKIISFPISFKALKELLFYKKKKQAIRGREYQNMDDVLAILLGIAYFMCSAFKEEKATWSEIDLLFNRTTEFAEITLNSYEKSYPRNDTFINLLKYNGKSFKEEIPPTLFLFSIIIYLNYWNKFCKKSKI